MNKRFIPVSAPVLAGNELEYVTDCIESSWISSCGKYVGRFEAAFAEFCGARYAVSCCNGTAALHLSLLALGIGDGDEVIVPTLTFVATANAVTYCGARPRFADVDPQTWTLDPRSVEALITPRTRAIIPVHLYGHVADMDAINELARRHGLHVVEDAAEAHGAEWGTRRAGSLGHLGAFSFYGNKIITTGEGGMLVTDDEEMALRARQFMGQGMDFDRRYWFPVVGHNYRMTNLTAAIGLAQMECADWHVARRAEVVAWYEEELRHERGVSWQSDRENATPAHWLFTIMLDEHLGVGRDDVMLGLSRHGVETRPVFYPMHVLPPYREAAVQDGTFPVAERVARRGLSLPTWAGMTRDTVAYICDALRDCLRVGVDD